MGRIVKILKWIGFVFFGIPLLLIVIGLFVSGDKKESKGVVVNKPSPASSPAEAKAPSVPKLPAEFQHAQIGRALVLNEKEFIKSQFNVLDATFEIENPWTKDVKDIEVECTQVTNSGTELSSTLNKTIYEIFPSKKKRIIKKFTMGISHPQAVRGSCSVVSGSWVTPN